MTNKNLRNIGATCRRIAVVLIAVISFCGFMVTNASAIDEAQRSVYSMLSSYILHRVPTVLENLRESARSDETLNPLLSRIKINAPVECAKLYPNAYAFESGDSNFIRFEAKFLGLIALDAAFGTIYATGWSNADDYFDASCRAYQASYKTSLNQSSKEPPHYNFDYATYLGKDTYFTAFASTLSLVVFDGALVWFLLHEAGHHALGHKPEEEPDRQKDFQKFAKYLADSRKKEEEADKWASASMQKLGYSLFGIVHYLQGKACTEACLKPLNLTIPENQSTHPSYRARYSSMKKEFDVFQSPQKRAYATVYVPFRADNEIIRHGFFTVPNKNSSLLNFVGLGTLNLSSNTRSVWRGACEWRNNTVHMYFRMPNEKERTEYVIRDASRARNVMNILTYDSNNQLISEASEWSFIVDSIWENVKFGDRTGGDNRKDLETGDFLARHLRKVGAPETAIKGVLKAFVEQNAAEKNILLAYGKGQISDATHNDRLTTIYKKYERDCESYLGKERAGRFFKSIENDPGVRLSDKILNTSERDSASQRAEEQMKKQLFGP
jgi:hypothetical protein